MGESDNPFVTAGVGVGRIGVVVGNVGEVAVVAVCIFGQGVLQLGDTDAILEQNRACLELFRALVPIELARPEGEGAEQIRAARLEPDVFAGLGRGAFYRDAVHRTYL